MNNSETSNTLTNNAYADLTLVFGDVPKNNSEFKRVTNNSMLVTQINDFYQKAGKIVLNEITDDTFYSRQGKRILFT